MWFRHVRRWTPAGPGRILGLSGPVSLGWVGPGYKPDPQRRRKYGKKDNNRHVSGVYKHEGKASDINTPKLHNLSYF